MRPRIAKICITLGIILLLGAGGFLGYTYYQNYKAEQASADIMQTILEDKTFWVDGIEYIGYLGIPSQGLTLPVMADIENLDLNLAPCKFAGNVKEDNLVIAGHNYVAHFGKLFNLVGGEDITFTDADQNVIQYKVVAIEMLDENETDRMVNSDYDLTLYTCTLDRVHRLTIRCNRV